MADEATLQRWLKDLNKGLDERLVTIDLYRDYYEGRHRSMFETAKYRQEFGLLTRGIHINFCLLVVDAARERLTIDGFRLGSQAANDSAWRLWQSNKLDARSDIAHTEALINGLAYLLVAPNPDMQKRDTPKIVVEDARQTIVAYDPEDTDRRTAGFKRVVGDDGYELGWLYLPEGIYKFRGRTKFTLGTRRGEKYWQRREVPGEDWPLRNPIALVPLVPIVNNPTIQNDGRSELQSVIAIQDMLNKLAADLVIASEFVAYPQRYATGVEVEMDAAGNPINPFQGGANRFIITEGENATFGQFPEGSLAPYVNAIEMFTQQIATITKTPPHYLLGQSGTFPSGESLKATETGLVSKVKQEQRFFGQGWEEAMVLAMKMAGVNVANPEAAEVVWHDPENRIQSELTDAVTKEQSIGVPFEFLMEKLGYTQTQIQRMKVMRLQESLQNQAPLVVNAQNPQPPPFVSRTNPPVQQPPAASANGNRPAA